MGKGNAFKLEQAYINYFNEFDKELAPLQIRLQDVAGDGNCLFRALADQVDGNESTHIFMREEACKYILKN